MKVRAVCFDLDNTLWDVWPVIMRAEQRMYDFLAGRYPRVVASMTMEMMRAAREQTAAAHPQMRHDFTFLRKQTLREHAREFGYAEAMVEEAFGAFIKARNEVDLYPDVLPALGQLRARFRLFTASNGNAAIGKVGLAHFFERRKRGTQFERGFGLRFRRPPRRWNRAIRKEKKRGEPYSCLPSA